MQNVEICLSGEWFEAINVSSHNVGGLFFCTIKHSALAVQNNLVSVDVLIPQERIRRFDFVKKTITFERDEQQRISIQPAKVLLKQWMDHVSHEAKTLLKQSDTNKISDRNVLKESQVFSKLTQDFGEESESAGGHKSAPSFAAVVNMFGSDWVDDSPGGMYKSNNENVGGSVAVLFDDSDDEVFTSNHVSDTVESGEKSGESAEESTIMTLSKNIHQKERPVTNTTSLWNLGKVENYHDCLDRMYSRRSEKKHWFRHAKRALPLDTYDTCVEDLLIEPLKDLFDDSLIAELISFLVVPLYFEVDFVETYRAKGKSDFLMTREVMFWSYECHNTAKEILRSIWKALYESKCRKFNAKKYINLKRRNPLYYRGGETFCDLDLLNAFGLQVERDDLPEPGEYKMISKAPWLLQGKTDLLYERSQELFSQPFQFECEFRSFCHSIRF